MNDAIQPPVGPITDTNKNLYVERDADRQALLHLQRGEIVTVIEPRQQGKSSLIHAIRRHPAMQSFSIVYVDVSTLRKEQASEWYSGFCSRILDQLVFLSKKQRPTRPDDANGFRTFLVELSRLFVQHDRSVIIALDEVSTLHFPGSTEFFAVLRDVYNSRDAEQYFHRITFMLFGVFRPQDLIQDPRVSPFNVAIRISLDDFTSDQVNDLLRRYGVDDSLINGLGCAIYRWTGGQPYLSQILCSRLSNGLEYDRLIKKDVSAEEAVAKQVERLFRKDDNHIKALVTRVEEALLQKDLSEELEKIANGGKSDFYPAALSWQEDLQLLGVIKEAPDHTCMIRNQIYVKALEISTQNRKSGSSTWNNTGGVHEKNIFERIFGAFKSVIVLPKYLGRFIFDLFGRQGVEASSSAIMGWILILLILLLVQGFIQMNAVVNLFKSVWGFFFP
jgi:hypothetical protein